MLRILTVLFFLTALPAPAAAQADDGLGTPPPVVTVQILRQQDKSGEAVLRLRAPVAMTGCANVGPLDYTLGMDDGVLNINLAGYNLDFADAPKQVGHPCHEGFQVPAAEIPIDRKMLTDNHIRAVYINYSGGLPPQIYDVALGKNNLTLTPRIRNLPPGAPESAQGGTVPLVFWYYPKGTLVLSARVAGGGDSQIRAFAAQTGLTPLRSARGLAPALDHAGRRYYIDTQGRFTTALGTGAGDRVIGHINNDGTSTEIYARPPGRTD